MPIDGYSNSCSFEESQLPITNYRIIYSGRFRERSKFLSLFIADSQPLSHAIGYIIFGSTLICSLSRSSLTAADRVSF